MPPVSGGNVNVGPLVPAKWVLRERIGRLGEHATALGANDQAGIAATLADLDQSHSQVQQLVGEVGARSAQLQITGANLDALNGQLQIRKSGLQEADLDETFTELARRQTAYQSAMLATSRIMSMSLTDYLR